MTVHSCMSVVRILEFSVTFCLKERHVNPVSIGLFCLVVALGRSVFHDTDDLEH